MKLILASNSPRRREILSAEGYVFEVIVSNADETIFESNDVPSIVKMLAKTKAQEVFKRFPDDIVLGADTVVVLDGEILGKPKDENEAFSMLKRLSGRTHTVFTGVAVLEPGKETVFAESSEVTFFELDDMQIKEYVKTGEPMDKAGAYGIQDKGKAFVKSVKGSYFNVVGLPIERVKEVLPKKLIKT